MKQEVLNVTIMLHKRLAGEYRTFNKNQMGTFGFFSPFSSQVGIVRSLSMNPNITSIRGFIESNEKDSKSSSELLSPIELLNPFTAGHADPPRISMAITQNKHTTPGVKQSKPLVNSGMHKSLAHVIGNDFVKKAQEDGKVEKIDQVNNVIILAYDDGTKGIVDISNSLIKNVKAGFFINNQLSHNLKEGQKFKKNDILAYNENFFKETNSFASDKNSLEFTNGLLKKVAICSEAQTFEDSILASETIAEELAFDVILDKSVSLGVSANIQKIVKIGSHVKDSEPLILFE